MSSLEATFHRLPAPILNKLQSLIRRVRRLLLLRGLFATLAVALACLIGIMLVDATVTLFSQGVRWALSLAGLAITVLAGWWFLFRPLSRKLTLTHIARILEIRHPELQERISTAVQLLSSDDPESIRGSEELIEAVVESAVVDVETVDPKTEFAPARARRVVWIAAALGALLLLAFLVWPHHTGTLLTRAVAPFLDIGNAYADTLTIDPGDVRIVEGDALTVTMTLDHRRMRRAEIRRLLPDGTESVERMTDLGENADGARVFATTFPSVNGSFTYRVRAGSAVSEWFDVVAVAPPSLEELRIGYDYPDYTGLDPVDKVSSNGEIRAVAHTVVTVTARADQPLSGAKLSIDDTVEPTSPALTGDTATWRFPLVPGMDGTWRLTVAGDDGFTNEPEPYALQVLPDREPAVTITSPMERKLRLKPTELLPLHYTAIEDFGFDAIDVEVSTGSERDRRHVSQPLPARAPGPDAWTGDARLAIASLDLAPHQKRLLVRLRARDSRPAALDGPGEGFSETIEIELDERAPSLARQTLDAQRRDLQRAIDEAQSEVKRAQQEMRQAEQELNRQEDFTDRARNDIEDFSDRAEQATETLKQIAAQLDGTLFDEQADAAEKVAEEEIAAARERADLIPVTDEKDERLAESKEATRQLDAALEKLQEIEDSIRDTQEDRETVARLADIANAQQQIASEAAEAADRARERQDQGAPENEEAAAQRQREQDQDLNRFRGRQEGVQRQLADMLEDNEEALGEILAEQSRRGEQLAEEAAQLAREQEALREVTREATQAEAGQEALAEALLEQLKEEQAAIARETAALAGTESRSVPENAPSAPGSDQEATSAPPAHPTDSAEPGDSAEHDEPGTTLAASEQTSEQSSAESAASEPDGSATDEPGLSAEGSNTIPPSPGRESTEDGDIAQMAAATDSGAPSEPSSESSTDPAAEAAAASEPAPASAPSLPSLAEAAERTQSAADSLNTEELEAAAEAAAAAAAALADAADAAPGAREGGEPNEDAAPERVDSTRPDGASPPPDPTSSSDSADSPTSEQLAGLAERQEAVASQIEAVRAGLVEDALAQMETRLAEESRQLSAEANSFERTLANLEQSAARSRADQARRSLARGESEAKAASAQLAQAQNQQSAAEESGQVEAGEVSSQARQSLQRGQSEQGQAQAQFAQAAQAFSQSAEQAAKVAESMQGQEAAESSSEQGMNPGDLAQSFSDVTQSASSRDAGEAAERSQEAAEALQQLAEAAMRQMGGAEGSPSGEEAEEGSMAEPGQMTEAGAETPPDSFTKTADAFDGGVPPELSRLGITADDWARFQGAVSSGSATAIESELPAEYRELVGRYFQVLAKEAGKKE